MPRTLIQRGFRERRRAGLVVVLLGAALLLGGADLAPAQTAAIAGLGGLALGLVSVLAPRLRGFAVPIALASLAFAGLMRALPGSPVDLAGPRVDLLLALPVWIGLVACARGLGRAARALPQPRLRRPRFRARATSPVDLYRLWYGLVPTPGQAARYGDPDLVAIEQMGLRLGRVRLVTATGPQPPRETQLQILEVEAPFHIRLRASAADARGVMQANGVSEIFLVDLGRRRLVLFAHEFPDIALGRALRTWLDDTPGRMLDRRLAIIERRARQEGAGLAPPAGGHAGGPTAPAAAAQELSEFDNLPEPPEPPDWRRAS